MAVHTGPAVTLPGAFASETSSPAKGCQKAQSLQDRNDPCPGLAERQVFEVDISLLTHTFVMDIVI